MQQPIYIKSNNKSDGKVHLEVHGFRHQELISIAMITDAIDRLPNAHIAKLTSISYEPRMGQGPLGQYLYDQSELAGCYTKKNHRITIHRLVDEPLFLHTLYHEIGHHVFYEVLKPTPKKQWVTQIYPHSDHVSEYAKRNAAEDFAETYATYLLDNEKLLHYAKKYTFMLQQVFV
jgi:hypothetical protein